MSALRQSWNTPPAAQWWRLEIWGAPHLIFDVFRKTSKRPKIAVVCANFGGIDDIKSIPKHPDIDTFYYTDIESKSDEASKSWTRIVTPDFPRHDFEARLRGRYFKHQIHRLDLVENYRWLAWIDANVSVIDIGFLIDAVKRMDRLPATRRVFLIPHPGRDTVRQEYECISSEIANGSEYLRLRYAKEKMREQMDYFSSKGWNLDARLWCGTVWIVENSPIIARCWDDWWDQNLRYGMMDQLSLPVLLDKHGITPQAAPFALDDNPYFEWGPHRTLM